METLLTPEVVHYGVDRGLIRDVPDLPTLASGAIAVVPVCHWWREARRLLGRPDFGVVEGIVYACPWTGRDYSFCVPHYIVFYDRAMAELADQEPMHRDVEWMFEELGCLSGHVSDVDRALLGHGYTMTLLPGDGEPHLYKNAVPVDGGLMVCSHWRWLPKEGQ